MKKYIQLLFIVILFYSCKALESYETVQQPKPPNYSQGNHWSSLPFRADAADNIPKYENWISDSLKEVDVFYVYPTLYNSNRNWNASLNDKKLNKRIDKLPVRLQASTFNKTARIYAPRYRQGNFKSFTDTTGSGEKALNLAYKDVKNAFEYYLENYNNGRPIIIASHSQGTKMCIQLMKDFFDNKPLNEKLVCAYLIGFAIESDYYTQLRPCQSAEENNCFVTWSTYKEGYVPGSKEDISKFLIGGKNMQVNPVSWKTDTLSAIGNGGILLNLSRKKLFQTTAKINKNYLEVETNTILFKRKNELHILDYNLFWHNLRDNVALRTQAFLEK